MEKAAGQLISILFRIRFLRKLDHGERPIDCPTLDKNFPKLDLSTTHNLNNRDQTEKLEVDQTSFFSLLPSRSRNCHRAVALHVFYLDRSRAEKRWFPRRICPATTETYEHASDWEIAETLSGSSDYIRRQKC